MGNKSVAFFVPETESYLAMAFKNNPSLWNVQWSKKCDNKPGL